MSRQDHWEEVYKTKGAETVSWFQPRPDLSLKLIAGIDPAHQDSVIDVGGGASTLVDHLLDGGWRDVAVLDLAGSALALSQRRLGKRAEQVQWLTGDVTSLDLQEARYGVWHDRAVFHFLTDPADQRAYAGQIAKALRPGGHAVIAAFAQDGPLKCSGLDVQRHSAESIAAILGEGFRLLASEQETHQTPAGKSQAFIYALFKKE